MLSQEEFKNALQQEIKNAGSQAVLAQKRDMTQSQISDYVRGRFQFRDMTVGTLYRLFPNTEIELRGECPPSREPIAQNLEDLLREIYHSLTPDQQVRCFAMIAANFGNRIRNKTE